MPHVSLFRAFSSAVLVFVATLSQSCGSIGPTAEAKKSNKNQVDLAITCEPALVYECEELCNRDDLDACQQAGISYFNGKHADKNPERAWELSERACEAGRQKACGVLGKLAQEGHHELAPAEIAKHLQQGCDGGDGDACQRYGLVLLEGKGVKKNPKEAHRLFQEACKRELPEACYQLGVSALTGREGFAKDLPRAAQLFTLACSKEVGDACAELGQMQWSGEGAAMDTLRAVQNLEKACRLDSAKGCFTLGKLHKEGKGITLDVGRAAELFDKACSLGTPEACVTLARMLRDGDGVEYDTDKAFDLFSKGCTSGLTGSCVEMGRMLSEGPQGFKKDHTAAQRTFRAACDAGDPLGCGYLGLQTLQGKGTKASPTEARPLLETGCEQGKLGAACVALAKLLASDRTSKKNASRAHKLSNDACAEKVAEGCVVLAELTEFGEGTTRSPHGAAKLFDKACSLGAKEGCVGAAKLALLGVGELSSRDATQKLAALCQEERSSACIALGRAYQLGKGVGQDRQRAFELFEAECKSGHQEACARQGYMHLVGRGAEKNEQKGRQLINAACDASEAVGCFYKTRIPGTTASEKAKLLERACEGRSAEACTELRR